MCMGEVVGEIIVDNSLMCMGEVFGKTIVVGETMRDFRCVKLHVFCQASSVFELNM